MTTYRYRGQTKEGAKVSGIVRAYDEYEAVAQLRDACAIITRLEPVKERENALKKPVGFRISEKQLALICSQFSIILSSGLPVTRCVEMVAGQTKNKYLRRMLEKVAEEVGAGYTMAQSFENNAPYLPATFVETIRAGEESGTLENCFARLHTYYDKSAKTKAKLISALTYPAMVVVAIIVFIIVMVVAVPAFTGAFLEMGTDLPGITLARFALTRAPLRRLHTMNAAAQFSTTLSTMLSAGLQVSRAMDVASRVIGNYVFALGIRQALQGVERGKSIAESMAEVEYFPPMLTEMVGVGERAGSLEETLDVIGAYFENEVTTTTNRLLSILEPVITIVLAVFVVVLLLSVYLPMFTLYGSI